MSNVLTQRVGRPGFSGVIFLAGWGLLLSLAAVWVSAAWSAAEGRSAGATGESASPGLVSRGSADAESWSAVLTRIDARRLRGLAMPSQDVTINSPLRGTIREILVREGQVVGADEPLVRLDDRLQLLATQMAQLRAASDAEIERAVAERDFAKLEHDQKVAAGDAVGKWEVERAKLEWDRTVAVLRSAEERKELAELEARIEQQRLEMHMLKAPMAGVIERVTGRAGVTVSDQDPIVRLLVLDPLEAQFFLPVEVVAKLAEGDRLKLVAMLPGERELVGEVRSIGRLIDSGGGTVRVMMAIDNPLPQQPGDPAQLPGGFQVRLIGPVF